LITGDKETFLFLFLEKNFRIGLYDKFYPQGVAVNVVSVLKVQILPEDMYIHSEQMVMCDIFAVSFNLLLFWW
jgi:hypothetical protein